MKRTITKLVLLLLAVLTTGSVNAATETYDFKALSQGLSDEYTKPTFGDNVTNDMQMISLGENTFNNRFSTGPRTQNSGNNCFRFRKTSKWEGLHNSGAYSGRYFSIRNLKAGDKITITLRSTNENIKFRDTGEDATKATVKDVTLGTDAVKSNQEYEIESDGIVNLETTGACIIEKIVIETSVPVTINIIPDATTEEYDFQTFAKNLTGDAALLNFILTGDDITNGASRKVKVINYDTEEFGGRFAVSKSDDNGIRLRKHATDAYNGIFYQKKSTDIYFSVLNLKNGDKIKFEGTNISQLAFDGTPALLKNDVEVTSSDDLEENTVYTVSTEASSVTLDFVTKDCSSTNLYIHKITIDPAAAHVGDYIGATLVSSTALDFTDVEGITAYVATAANAGIVTFSKVTKVEAETPLYIKANEERGSVINVNVPVATKDAVDYSSTNLLKGFASQTTPLQSDANTKYYVFGVQDNTAGFYHVPTSGFTSAAGKAYLELTAKQAASSRISMLFDEGSETTGINMIQSSEVKAQESDAYYNLAGQRVVKPTRGLYIVNGKKVFIK